MLYNQQKWEVTCPFHTSIVKMIRNTSTQEAVTHSDYAFVRSPAKSLDVAEPVELHHYWPRPFSMVRNVVAISQKRKTLVSNPSWKAKGCYSQCDKTLGVRHYILRRSNLSSGSAYTFTNACILESEIAHTLHGRHQLALGIQSFFVSMDDRNSSEHETIADLNAPVSLRRLPDSAISISFGTGGSWREHLQDPWWAQ